MKQYLKKFRVAYISAWLLSFLATLGLFLCQISPFYNTSPDFFRAFVFAYFLSFTIVRIQYECLLRKRKITNQKFFRDALELNLRPHRIFYSFWLTIPNAITYSFILKDHLVAMYFVWFLSAGISIWLLKNPWYPKEETTEAEQEKK